MREPVTLVIAVVGGVLLLCVGGIVALAVLHDPIPDTLSNIAVGSLGLLGGILVPNQKRPAATP